MPHINSPRFIHPNQKASAAAYGRSGSFDARMENGQNHSDNESMNGRSLSFIRRSPFLSSGKEGLRSFLHQSLNSPNGDRYTKQQLQQIQQNDLDEEIPLTIPNQRKHSKTPTTIIDATQENRISPTRSKSDSPFNSNKQRNRIRQRTPPKKAWERHYRSFLSKLSNQNNNKSNNHSSLKSSFQNSSPSSADTTSSSKSGGRNNFVNLLKKPKDRLRLFRSTSISSAKDNYNGFFENSPSTDSPGSNISLDTSLRRGKERLNQHGHSSHDSFLVYMNEQDSQRKNNDSNQHSKHSNKHRRSISGNFYNTPPEHILNPPGRLPMPHFASPLSNNSNTTPTEHSSSYPYVPIYMAPTITGDSVLIPPPSSLKVPYSSLSSSLNNSDLDTPLRGGIRRYNTTSSSQSYQHHSSYKNVYSDDLEREHEDQRTTDIRRSFTEFHSSNEYGKDSTSAYLGENSSRHGGSLFLDMMNRNLSLEEKNNMSNIKNATKNLKKNKSFSFSKPVRNLDLYNPQSSLPKHLSSPSPLPPVSEGEASWIPDRVLNSLEGIETWDTNGENIKDGQLIAPAIITMCPVNVFSFLACKGSTTPISFNDGVGNNNNHSSTASFYYNPFGKSILGTAFVTPFGPRLASDEKYGWTKTLFVLRQNYLFEYSIDHNVDGKPRGYVHLQYCVIRPHSEFCDTFELILHDGTGISTATATEQTNNVMTRPKMLLIKVGSKEERDRWVHAITKASKLSVDDLYIFDDLNQSDSLLRKKKLGNGRYSKIYAARRKLLEENETTSTSLSSLQGDNNIEPMFPSDEDADVVNGNDGNDSSLELNCALKIIPKSLFWERVRNGHERVDTLVRETTVQATLTAHANQMGYDKPPFLRLRSFFETRETVVLELELLKGTDLFQYVHCHGSLKEKESAYIMKDVLKCLSVTEKLGIAHRDVKPANILMCNKRKDGVRVKVGDYGMSTYVGLDGLVRGRCGTPGYVAPEIFAAGVNGGYKNKVDIFSAGVTLYVLLCGYEPFYGETDAELMAANKAAKVEFPADDWEQVSDEAKDLVVRMMEIDPSQRISAKDALQHPWIVHWNASELDTMDENHCQSLESDTACVIS